MSRLTSLCQEVYYGLTPKALRARYALVVFDLFIISYFVVTTFMRPYDWIVVTDLTIGALLVIDFLGRMAAHPDRGAFIIRPMSLVDLVVIGSGPVGGRSTSSLDRNLRRPWGSLSCFTRAIGLAAR